MLMLIISVQKVNYYKNDKNCHTQNCCIIHLEQINISSIEKKIHLDYNNILAIERVLQEKPWDLLETLEKRRVCPVSGVWVIPWATSCPCVWANPVPSPGAETGRHRWTPSSFEEERSACTSQETR